MSLALAHAAVGADPHFLSDTMDGLGSSPKTLPPKYFYDSVGSALFDQITETAEYYPTRTEMRILRDNAQDIAQALGNHATIIEPGAGSSTKVRVLLDALDQPTAYAPMDISAAHLAEAATKLARAYPHIPIKPMAGDYTQLIKLPAGLPRYRRTVFYPGSTIGNFTPDAAIAFLRRLGDVAGGDGKLLIGADTKKDTAILEAAYDDASGVTAAFNLNVLVRIRDELAGAVRVDQFRHRAIYNVPMGRIEMRLESLCDQVIVVGGEVYPFEAGETICTEYSHKFTPAEFQAVAAKAGWHPMNVWTDPDQMFAVYLFTR